MCSVTWMQIDYKRLVSPRCVGQSGSQSGDRQGSRGGASARRQGGACTGNGGGQAQGGARQAQARRCCTAPTEIGLRVSAPFVAAQVHIEHGMVQEAKSSSQGYRGL